MQSNIIITQGACGTNSLVKGTNKRDAVLISPNVLSGDDVHIHTRDSKDVDSRFPNSKIIYIFPNPYDLVLSSSGRKFGEDTFIYYHSGNLIPKYIRDEDNKYKQFCDTNGHPTGTSEEILIKYLDFNQDIMGLEDHYNKWRYNKNRSYSIRFVKYEGLLEHGVSLFNDWWGLNIPEYLWNPLKRSANYKNLSKDTISKLELLYGEWFEKYQSLPLVEDLYPKEEN
jgi:hypothetical protein